MRPDCLRPASGEGRAHYHILKIRKVDYMGVALLAVYILGLVAVAVWLQDTNAAEKPLGRRVHVMPSAPMLFGARFSTSRPQSCRRSAGLAIAGPRRRARR